MSKSQLFAQDETYVHWAYAVADKIKQAHTQTALRVNNDLLTLYWEIGCSICEQQQLHGWGSKVIDLLATDLAHHFPNNSGFSVRNLKYMKAFAEAYPDFPMVQVPLARTHPTQFVQVPLAQITWNYTASLFCMITITLGVAPYQLEQLVKAQLDELSTSKKRKA